MGKHIAISGLIGSYKTTVSSRLGEEFGIEVIKEPYQTCPYLKEFYQEPGVHTAFAMQTWFLAEKLAIQNLIQEKLKYQDVIQDTSVFDVVAFATAMKNSGTMNEQDFTTYHRLYSTITANLRPPDAILYMDTPIEIVKQRIKERAERERPYELNIDDDYLNTLDSALRDFVARMNKDHGVPVCMINNPDVYDKEKLLYMKRLVSRIIG
jgi:deoxyadenosine/deoxycytidine kinase